MHVLMGVDVRRVRIAERAKTLQLAACLSAHRRRVAGVDDPIARRPAVCTMHPFGDVKVQPEGQRGSLSGQRTRRLGIRATDHEAGAAHDAGVVGSRDALVHCRAQPEVVGVDDEALHSSSLSRAFDSTAAQS